MVWCKYRTDLGRSCLPFLWGAWRKMLYGLWAFSRLLFLLLVKGWALSQEGMLNVNTVAVSFLFKCLFARLSHVNFEADSLSYLLASIFLSPQTPDLLPLFWDQSVYAFLMKHSLWHTSAEDTASGTRASAESCSAGVAAARWTGCDLSFVPLFMWDGSLPGGSRNITFLLGNNEKN